MRTLAHRARVHGE